MAPVVAEIALENRNTFAVVKLDMDRNLQTLRKYRVNIRPTYIVFQDGDVVGRFHGVKSKNQLLQNILSVIDVE